MIFAISLTILNIVLIAAAFMDAPKKLRKKFKARVPKGEVYKCKLVFYDSEGREI